MENNIKKRGRRKKNTVNEIIQAQEQILQMNDNIYEEISIKKRGRKPKGGKIYPKKKEKNDENENIENVILHLKCHLKDLVEYDKTSSNLITNELNYNPNVPPEIKTYDAKNTMEFFPYENPINETDNKYAYINTEITKNIFSSHCSYCQNKTLLSDNDESKNREEIKYNEDDANIKEINKKLKELKLNLYNNNLNDKKSACFWCTFEFDNVACHIPKYEMDDKIHGYGSFCRPECAVAFLMRENIDDSTKFERYHLLNQIYGKIYDYNKNIKPAPNPHYLLDKFYGSLSIQEYRKLLKTDHLLFMVEKPMTRVLPELYEDNDNFMMSMYVGKNNLKTGNVYRVKKKSDKSNLPNKNTIIKDNFGKV